MKQLELIHVIEGSRVRDYKLEYSTSNCPFYSNPEPAHPDPDLIYTDDFIFFPDLTNKFHVYPKDKREAYRLVFASPGHILIDMSNVVDNPPPPIKQVTIMFVVQRVIYTVKNRDTIFVRRVGAALVPARSVDIRGGEKNVEETMNEVIARIIDQHCTYYTDHKI